MSKDRSKFDKLANVLDELEFDVEDMLAVVCANLCRQQGKQFKTVMAVGGYKYTIQFDKEVFL